MIYYRMNNPENRRRGSVGSLVDFLKASFRELLTDLDTRMLTVAERLGPLMMRADDPYAVLRVDEERRVDKFRLEMARHEAETKPRTPEEMRGILWSIAGRHMEYPPELPDHNRAGADHINELFAAVDAHDANGSDVREDRPSLSFYDVSAKAVEAQSYGTEPGELVVQSVDRARELFFGVVGGGRL